MDGQRAVKSLTADLNALEIVSVFRSVGASTTFSFLITQEAIGFIEKNKGRPFFLYLPHAMPGSDIAPFASKAFRGKSANGLYGDSVEEIDSEAQTRVRGSIKRGGRAASGRV